MESSSLSITMEQSSGATVAEKLSNMFALGGPRTHQTDSCNNDGSSLESTAFFSTAIEGVDDDLLSVSDDSRSSSSSSSSSSWAPNDYVDLRYSVTSNMFFFAGACCQTIMSVWDLRGAIADANGENDDDSTDDDNYVYTTSDKVYYFLYTLGPFLYLLNACTEIRWALAYWNCPSCCSQSEAVTEAVTVSTGERDDIANGSGSVSSYSTEPAEVSREECWRELMGGIIFGVGALFEIYSTLLDDVYEDADDYDDDAYLLKVARKRGFFVSNYKMNMVAMHLYLLSGILDLVSHRRGQSRRWNLSDSESFSAFIMFLGTLFFVIGTCMDAVLSYFYDPEFMHGIDPHGRLDISDLALARSDLTSSILWNLDAICYIIADILIYGLCYQDGTAWSFFCNGKGKENIEPQESLPLLDTTVVTKNYSTHAI